MTTKHFRCAGFILCALSLLAPQLLIAQKAPPPPKPFELTVDSIMRGPRLVGYPPTGVYWSQDSQRVYFRWKQADEPRLKETSLYVVNRDGTGLRRLSDNEARQAPPANGEFDQHQRKYDQCQAEKIEKHEGSAAIGADLIWEFPYAPQSDCGADRCQNETCRTGPEITRLGHWAIPVCVPLIPSLPIDLICFSSISAAHKTLVEFLFNDNSTLRAVSGS